jgi:uncharacterized membrane protein (GlpM family)
VRDVVSLIAKALAGGALVVVFALVCECSTPKRFAGLFGAAPAVAIAGLIVTLVAKGAHDAREATIGMLAGCAGMAAYAMATASWLKRMRPLAASGLALGVWAVVAGAIAGPLL